MCDQRHLLVSALDLAVGPTVSLNHEAGSQPARALMNVGQAILLGQHLSRVTRKQCHPACSKRCQKGLMQVAVADNIAQRRDTKLVVSDECSPKAATLRDMNGLDRCCSIWPCTQVFEQDTAAVIDGQHARVSCRLVAICRCPIGVQHDNAFGLAGNTGQQQRQRTADWACPKNGNIRVLLVHDLAILRW